MRRHRTFFKKRTAPLFFAATAVSLSVVFAPLVLGAEESSVCALYLDGDFVCCVTSSSDAGNAIRTIQEERFSSLPDILPSGGTLTLSTSVEYDEISNTGDHLCNEEELIALLYDDQRLQYTYTCQQSSAVLLPYETVYRENDDGFDGITTMISEGSSGLAHVVCDITYDAESGEELASVELSREVVKEPVSAVAYKGTTPLTDVSVTTGTYIWPLPDNDTFLAKQAEYETKYLGQTEYISSMYGGRDLWGSYDFHLGYDIAAPYGTEIYACDGGVVVYAHYSASYGYCVRIRHANGMETVYAHQAWMVVHDGDIVTQGQVIGYVGATGSTSGNHLHLEFRKNHVTCSPEEYIQIPDNVPYVEAY